MKANESKLNEKIANWLGIKPVKFKDCHSSGYLAKKYPEDTCHWELDGNVINSLPEFTRSLEACFLWVTPKLSHSYTYTFYKWCDNWVAEFHNDETFARADSFYDKCDTPAMSFCVALEKLIDET